jgi:WD40 repeat protein
VIRAEGPQEFASGRSRGIEKPRLDLYGDSLPKGAISRLGSIRYRGQDSIQNVGFLPGELVVVTPDRGLRYYEAATGKLRRKVPVGVPWVNSSAMTRDRKWLALTGFHFDDKRAAYLYYLKVLDAATGKPRLSIERTEEVGGSVAISDDGLTVATAEEQGHLRLWDVAAGIEILDNSLDGLQRVGCMAFSPDSAVLAIGGVDKVALWRWTAGEEPQKVGIGDGKYARYSRTAAFAPDGATLVLGSDGGPTRVTLIDVASRTVAAELGADEDRWRYTSDVAFSPDGTYLAAIQSGGDGGRVIFWDHRAKRRLRTFETSRGATNLAFSPDGRMLAAASNWENTLDLWDVETGRRIPGGLVGHETGPGFIRFLDGNRQVVTAGDDGTIRVWETQTGRQIRSFAHRSSGDSETTPWIRGFALSPDARLAASSSLDDTVRLWDVGTGQEIYRLPGHGRLGGHRTLAFTSDGRRFVSWGDDMRVYLWDVATGKAVEEYLLQPSGVKVPDPDDPSSRESGMFSRSAQSGLSPDGSRLALDLGSIYIFDTATGKELLKLDPEPGYRIDLAISPDNRFLLTSRWGRPVETKLADGRVHSSSEKNHVVALRRLDGGAIVKEIVLPEGGAGPVAFSADGSRFAIGVGQADPLIRIFDTSSTQERARITGLESVPTCLAFSQDGKLLAAGLRNGTGVIWDTAQAVDPPSKPR